MLATIIILSIIVAVAIAIFAVKAANVKHAIEDIYAKQALLHDKYCNHEDRIDGNYKSLAELNRRQDEWRRQHNDSDAALRGAIKDLQDYNAEREKKAREAVEEFKNTMNCIAEMAERKRAEKAAKAKGTSKASDTPATGRQETRDAKQNTAEKRKSFAVLRETFSVRDAAKELGVSRTTARRYEQWRKTNAR